MSEFRVGVDIGGTFTDIVFLGGDGRVLARKVASTPDDYSRAVLDGIAGGLEDLGVAPGSVSEVSHGFTVATNAIIEQKGAHTALITTEGFRDILEFRRNRTPRLYDLYYEKSPTLIKRQFRLEVGERLNFRGEVLRPLDVDDVDRAVQSVLDSGVESVAVCLLHSYANPDHEQYIAQVLRERAPDVILTLSSDLLPEMKEYERTSTTVINSYVRPVVERYLTLLTGGLTDMGVTVPLTVMQSNGGLATSDIAKERPVYCIESGPAAGVVGAYHLGRRLGMSNLMTLDMGGTTAKASIIENGEMLQAPEYEVGGEISVGHRLLRGSGHILPRAGHRPGRSGGGRGSIATVDRSGSLRVGPQSSGAFPGPACYRLGGPDATVTDADVLLGYLNPQHLLAGDFEIDAELARQAVADHVARPLGLSEVEAAHGIHTLVNSNMGRALRAVSSERGRDPRRFDLVCFGGGGPVHAAGLAEMLDISRVVVPPFPGVFSSFGLLVADVEHHFVQTYFKTFDEIDVEALSELLEGLWQEGRRQLRLEGFDDQAPRADYSSGHEIRGTGLRPDGPLPARAGQPRFLDLGRPGLRLGTRAVVRLQHRRRLPVGQRACDCQRSVGTIPQAGALRPGRRFRRSPKRAGTSTSVPIAAGRILPWSAVAALAGQSANGPLIIEEYDSTTVVPPRLDRRRRRGYQHHSGEGLAGS